MRIAIGLSTTLACLFIFLAGFNVWNMLSGRTSARNSRLWVRFHRIAGYSFIAIFAFFLYVMALRIRGLDELSPRLILHIGMALLLAPLIFAKVLVARFQKGSRGLLAGLGIGIFAASFTLVALNLGVHFLRDASRRKVPATVSVFVGLFTLGIFSIGFLFKRLRTAATPRIQLPYGQPPASSEDKDNQGLTLTLARIQPVTHDAKCLRFLLPPGKHLRARPGQFLAFEWLISGKKVVRCYSICSSSNQSGYIEITPKRVSDGYVSKFLNDEAQVGLTVQARGPYGKFCFDESQHKHVVFLAGGSGITPIIAMLRYMDDLCSDIHAKLIYCVRSEKDVLFSSDLINLQNRLKNFRYTVVLSQPSSDWKGVKGRLTGNMLAQEIENPLDSTFFVCGPPPFMDHVRSSLSAMRVKPSSILQESFGSVPGEKPTPSDAGPLKITYTRSSTTCSLLPGQTVLENAEAHGVAIPYGCRQGVCGTCITKLISGNVQMGKAEALSQDLRAQGYILPCVSRPVNDVVLDA